MTELVEALITQGWDREKLLSMKASEIAELLQGLLLTEDVSVGLMLWNEKWGAVGQESRDG